MRRPQEVEPAIPEVSFAAGHPRGQRLGERQRRVGAGMPGQRLFQMSENRGDVGFPFALAVAMALAGEEALGGQVVPLRRRGLRGHCDRHDRNDARVAAPLGRQVAEPGRFRLLRQRQQRRASLQGIQGLEVRAAQAERVLDEPALAQRGVERGDAGIELRPRCRRAH